MSERSGPPSDEGDGDRIRPFGEDDSSEEESQEDPEEVQRIKDGFIVDEDEEDEDADAASDDSETRRRKRKERKRKRRKKRAEREAMELSDDDLDLIGENTGRTDPSRSSQKLNRLRRRGDSLSGGEEPGLQDIFRDEEDRNEQRAANDDMDVDDMDDFIEDDDEPDGFDGETEEERRARRREEKRKKREAARGRPNVSGLAQQAIDEMYAVFGDGHEYDWALEGEEGMDVDEEDAPLKQEVTMAEVFEPSEMAAVFKTQADEIIRDVDRPERHQLLSSTLAVNPSIVRAADFPPLDLAIEFVLPRISVRTNQMYVNPPPPEDNPMWRSLPEILGPFKTSVTTAMRSMFLEHCEVPFLWQQMQDHWYFVERDPYAKHVLLDQHELWSTYNLGCKFRAIYERHQNLRQTFDKLKDRNPGLEDELFETKVIDGAALTSLEASVDGQDWLSTRYPREVRALREEELLAEGSRRRPAPRTVQERTRESSLNRLVEVFGASPSSVIVAFSEATRQDRSTDYAVNPHEFAEEFVDESSGLNTGADVLAAARSILQQEFAKHPLLRMQARDFFQQSGRVTVFPTERGSAKIDKYHMYYSFKYVTTKPVELFANTAQFLHILAAEAEGLVKIEIDVVPEASANFVDHLIKAYLSESYGETSKAWNEQRAEIVRAAWTESLMPVTAKWIREQLREQAETHMAERCGAVLEQRAMMAPLFKTPEGEVKSILAVSNGRGARDDPVLCVFVDRHGRVRDQTRFDNLTDDKGKEGFLDLLNNRPPGGIVVGGLSIETSKLFNEVRGLIGTVVDQAHHLESMETIYQQVEASFNEYGTSDPAILSEQKANARAEREELYRVHGIPISYVPDSVARLYMNSQRAQTENPGLPLTGRFALALARYAQNPLNSYCSLGADIVNITFVEHHQKLVPQEKLLIQLERALANVVNSMGVDINACIGDLYKRTLLPFVSGLGPRKARALIDDIGKRGNGRLSSRMMLSEIVGWNVFNNSSAFLYVINDLQDYDMDIKDVTMEGFADPLDMTRIHPNEYDLARKMCADNLDLDPDDVADQHPSMVVKQVMEDEASAEGLRSLALDDFADSMKDDKKRIYLDLIVEELINPRADRRPQFVIPDDWEVLTMLTGESKRTIDRGIIVSAFVARVSNSNGVFCRLDSGIEAYVDTQYISDDFEKNAEDVVQRNQTIQAVVVDVNPRDFKLSLSLRAGDIEQGQRLLPPFRQDDWFDLDREEQATAELVRKKRREANKSTRVIKHPNWHNMNSGQAEAFLANQQRGDVVIRPSSKGTDHIAVTWKVDNGIFQHIDVKEKNKENEFSLGRVLSIGETFKYGDLDELIVKHVKAICRKLDEVALHEKYRAEEDLESFLKTYVLAHPGRSIYGFSLDSKKPGYLRLCFLNKATKDGGVMQTWPVKVLPNAYQLGPAQVPGVLELCNAFKAQYAARLEEQGAGGKTPGTMLGRTPMHGGRTPGGGMTPGHFAGGRTPMHGARTPMARPVGGSTPNPYSAPPRAGMPPPSAPYPIAVGYGQQPPGGYQNYAPPPPPPQAYGPPGGYGGPPPPPSQNYPPQGYPPQGYPPQGYPPQNFAPPQNMPPRFPQQQYGGGPAGGMNPDRAAMLSRQSNHGQ